MNISTLIWPCSLKPGEQGRSQQSSFFAAKHRPLSDRLNSHKKPLQGHQQTSHNYPKHFPQSIWNLKLRKTHNLMKANVFTTFSAHTAFQRMSVSLTKSDEQVSTKPGSEPQLPYAHAKSQICIQTMQKWIRRGPEIQPKSTKSRSGPPRCPMRCLCFPVTQAMRIGGCCRSAPGTDAALVRPFWSLLNHFWQTLGKFKGCLEIDTTLKSKHTFKVSGRSFLNTFTAFVQVLIRMCFLIPFWSVCDPFCCHDLP